MRIGQRLTLDCSCEADVVVPLILRMPRHSVVRICARGEKCNLDHVRGRRVVVRWQLKGRSHRAFKDIRTP
jgi:hypothetical protein